MNKIKISVFFGIVAFTMIVFYTSSTAFFQGRLARNLKPLPAYNENTCYDPDEGKNYEVQSTTFGKMAGRSSSESKFTDYCDIAGKLVEYSCDGKKVIETKENCDSWCNEGRCITEKNIDKTTCGDTVKQTWEECDGDSFCTSECKIKTTYKVVPWQQESFQDDHKLKVGDKLQVGGELNIRIEKIQKEAPPHVTFSIWSKNINNECKFISNTGQLSLKNPNDWETFREFTDSFIELMEVNNDEVTIRRYMGPKARQRCQEIIPSDKKNLACSFYPDNNGYYVENAYFRVHFNSKKNQSQQRAEYTANVLQNCFDEIKKKFPSAEKATLNDKWAAYPKINSDSYSGASADYQRISLPSTIIDVPGNGQLYDRLLELKNGQCLLAWDNTLSHELTHLIFFNTILQRGYDHGSSILPNNQSSSSLDLSEGQADYLPKFIARDYSNFENADWYNKQICLKDTLKDTSNGAKPEELKYKNIFAGKGFDQNHYEAGYCFFDRVENICGKDSISYLFEEVLKKSGSYESQPTIFSILASVCDESKVKEIMTDFGFDQSLLELQETYPVGSFDSGKNTPGCL